MEFIATATVRTYAGQWHSTEQLPAISFNAPDLASARRYAHEQYIIQVAHLEAPTLFIDVQEI